MGANWDSTIVEGPVDCLAEIAKEAVVLLPFVFKQQLAISACRNHNFSSIWSIEGVGFKKGIIRLQSPTPCSIIGRLEMQNEQMEQITKYSCNFALAVIASKLLGNSRWIFYSDSLCQSASAYFKQGILEKFLWADVDETPDYWHAAITAVKELIPSVNYVDDDLFQMFYGEDTECHKMQIR